MAKKKKMKKGKMAKAKDARNWVLATNPSNNNQCFCFFIEVPNTKWVTVNTYKTQPECTQFIPKCREFFKMQSSGLVEVHKGHQQVTAKVKDKFVHGRMGMGMMKK